MAERDKSEGAGQLVNRVVVITGDKAMSKPNGGGDRGGGVRSENSLSAVRPLCHEGRRGGGGEGEMLGDLGLTD